MDIIELFKQAAVAMQSDIRYLELDAARRAVDEDKELQDMIGQFNLIRMEANEAMFADERDENHINELNEKSTSLYRAIMNHQKMLEFNEAKTEMDKMVSHIDAIINTAVNGGDPTLVQEPHGGCSGSCSTCAGCH